MAGFKLRLSALLSLILALAPLAADPIPKDTLPRVRFKVNPRYTTKARLARIEGLVALNCVVDTDGKAVDIKVERSLGKGLDEKAIEALRKWIFYPATKDGVPVRWKAMVDISFKLRE